MSSIIDKIKDKVTGTSEPADQHLAALLTAKSSPLEVTHRPTPTPGPNELLIDVQAIAVNPVDWYMCETGFAFTSYPGIVGSDVGGTVISSESPVPSDTFKPGTRVLAFATSFFHHGAPDYGAFQKRVLVPAPLATPIPQSMSFKEASVLPMAVFTVWTGWYTIGLPRDTLHTPADKQGMLVWGGASSVGSVAVQVAKLMGFTVYSTSSATHHEYLKSLGASKVFDYKREDVVESIVKAAKEDGLTFQTGFDAVGQLKFSLEVLKQLKGPGLAKLASANRLTPDSPKMEGVDVKFIEAPKDEKERLELSHWVFNIWLKEKLEKGELVPSPKIRLVDGGLEAANKALDEWRKGVSGEKIVFEV